MKNIEIYQKIKALIQEGESFTFENFSSQKVRKLPAELSPKWVSWQNRVYHLINTHFSQESSPYLLLKQGYEINLIGAKENKFKEVKNYIIQALSDASKFIEFNNKNNLKTKTAILNKENKKKKKH